MSAPSLTAKYRPQRFSDVAGQEAVKRILSKASAEDKVAPAYLFSGTRGVGKTTLARVLAKALNCVTAPTGEPCNECAQCRQITAGISPDVIEIDAATHGNVEEARRLKEDIGYAPLQSRYKVFIIDEAHMLSKAAFNALLKTLEEPPPRVTFILATTEPHKILPTIISRCQHYVFKRLAQPELEAHLEGLLSREGMEHDHSAVSLIARRGAGSVRDSMSLLAQVLAMGQERLTEQDVRDVLGLAGQDVFFSFMKSFSEQDCLGVSGLLRQVLDRGLDIGFFLRELASCWRNMFLLNQAGEKALETLELTAEEGLQWLTWAKAFDARHIHSCWQMTLEGQRRVMTSLEPALALELLLLNLAYIPKLLSLEAIGAPQAPGRPAGAPPQGGQYGSYPRPASSPAQGGQYGAYPNPAGAPAQGGQYGARQNPAPGAAQGGYGAPQQPAYGGPQPNQEGAAQAPQYGGGRPAQGGAPQGAQYGGPQGGGYGAPQGGQYGGSRPGQNASGQGGQYGAPPASGQAPAGGRAPYGAPAHAAPGGARPAQAGQPGGYGPQGGQNPQGGYQAAPQYPAQGQPGYGQQPTAPPGGGQYGQGGHAAGQSHGREPEPSGEEPDPARHEPRGAATWKGFKDFAKNELKKNPLIKVALPHLTGKYDETGDKASLVLSCKNEFQANQLKDKPENFGLLTRLASDYFGRHVTVSFTVPEGGKALTAQELRGKAEQTDLFKEARESMGAYIIDVRAKN